MHKDFLFPNVLTWYRVTQFQFLHQDEKKPVPHSKQRQASNYQNVIVMIVSHAKDREYQDFFLYDDPPEP